MSLSTINPSHLARVGARKVALKGSLETVVPAGAHQVALEIGCGHGHFLARLASVHPMRFFVGIDILNDRLKRAEKKQRSLGLNNLRFVKAEATEFLECIPPDIKFAEVVVLFPDPWPKKRHHKNRLIQPGFLSKLALHARPECRLYFRTDHLPYHESALEILSAHSAWQIVAGAPWIFEEQTVFQAKAARFDSLVAAVKIPKPEAMPVG
jgi:tRNA (guanine-N7-)-methyltransferase